MIIGLIRCECVVYNCQSLKDKRSVVKSVLQRIRNTCNVSVGEVDHQDVWQRTALAFTAVGSSRVAVERELRRALSVIDQSGDLEVTLTTWEWL